MACNTPIVSTDVGDVKEVIGKTEGCLISSYDYIDLSSKIEDTLNFDKRTQGREAIHHMDADLIATEIITVYNKVLI